MKKLFKILFGTIGGLLILCLIAFPFRWTLLVNVWALAGPPPLAERTDEGPDARWFDDYFIIIALDQRTFAIGEPRYWQKNFSYLIVGDESAILFDAGPGMRDIRPVIASLTNRPFLFIPSHLHFDHVGNGMDFKQVGIIDLPHLRQRAANGQFRLEPLEHLGKIENFPLPSWTVTRWLAPGSQIDLGGRQIEIVYTPGHTRNSVSLVDVASQQAFTGDFMGPGPMAPLTPDGNMGDYLQGVEALLRVLPIGGRLYGAHRPIYGLHPMDGPSDLDQAYRQGTPVIGRDDLVAMRDLLAGVRSGSVTSRSLFMGLYPVSERVELWAVAAWFQDWTPGYPELSPDP